MTADTGARLIAFLRREWLRYGLFWSCVLLIVGLILLVRA